MSHYYIIFDHTTSQVGFAPLVNSPTMKSAVVQGETPTTSYDSPKTTASAVSQPIIILLVLIIMVAMLVGVYFA
jgi:ABC-type multidrug transport system permease subunit